MATSKIYGIDPSLPRLEVVDLEDWHRYWVNHDNDLGGEYIWAVKAFATRWAGKMQGMLTPPLEESIGATIRKSASSLAQAANLEGITMLMFHVACDALLRYWCYREPLQAWYHGTCQQEEQEVVARWAPDVRVWPISPEEERRQALLRDVRAYCEQALTGQICTPLDEHARQRLGHELTAAVRELFPSDIKVTLLSVGQTEVMLRVHVPVVEVPVADAHD